MIRRQKGKTNDPLMFTSLYKGLILSGLATLLLGYGLLNNQMLSLVLASIVAVLFNVLPVFFILLNAVMDIEGKLKSTNTLEKKRFDELFLLLGKCIAGLFAGGLTFAISGEFTDNFSIRLTVGIACAIVALNSRTNKPKNGISELSKMSSEEIEEEVEEDHQEADEKKTEL